MWSDAEWLIRLIVVIISQCYINLHLKYAQVFKRLWLAISSFLLPTQLDSGRHHNSSLPEYFEFSYAVNWILWPLGMLCYDPYRTRTAQRNSPYVPQYRVSLAAQMVTNPPAMQETPGFNPCIRKVSWRREWQPTPIFLPGEFKDWGDWQTTVHEVIKSLTQLSE